MMPARIVMQSLSLAARRITALSQEENEDLDDLRFIGGIPVLGSSDLPLDDRYVLLDPGHRVELHLVSPRSIDGPQTLGHDGGNIGREIRHKNVLAVEDQAIGP